MASVVSASGIAMIGEQDREVAWSAPSVLAASKLASDTASPSTMLPASPI